VIALLSLAFAGSFDDFDSATATEPKLDALFAVLDDESLATDHPLAWSKLGQVFADEGLEGAAIIAWSHAFESTDTPPDAAVQAIELADEVGDAAVVAGPLAAHDSLSIKDGDARSHVAYVVARDQLRRDNLGPSIHWLKKVDGESPDFADAEALRAVVLANQGKNEAALVPLQTARALGVSKHKGERFDQKIVMNLARVYYATDNWGQSIYHYKQIPRSSEYWAEAHFEQAWANFRGANMPGTIGLLLSHSSPFLEDLWYPEADMLRAQALFMMCKFGTAVEEMNRFQERYTPIQEKLDAALSGMDEEAAYTDLGHYLDQSGWSTPGILLRKYRTEDRIAESRQAVAHYRAEADELESIGKHADKVGAWLDSRADAIVQVEGARILSRLQTQRDELSQMLTDLELARIDILQLESRLYEQAAATGVLQDVKADRIGKLRNLKKSKKGYQVWPFEGEYWADEVGWYEVHTRSDCPENLARKIGG